MEGFKTNIVATSSSEQDDVLESIVWTVSSSMISQCREFMNVAMYYLSISWATCFQRGRKVKLVHTSSWTYAPHGVLKMNYSKSFIKKARKGGYGGVVRGNTSQILCCYPGLVECIDSHGHKEFSSPC